MDWPIMVEGQSEPEAERNPALNLQIVTHDFFRTMRMPVRQGRTFDDRDTAGRHAGRRGERGAGPPLLAGPGRRSASASAPRCPRRPTRRRG